MTSAGVSITSVPEPYRSLIRTAYEAGWHAAVGASGSRLLSYAENEPTRVVGGEGESPVSAAWLAGALQVLDEMGFERANASSPALSALLPRIVLLAVSHVQASEPSTYCMGCAFLSDENPVTPEWKDCPVIAALAGSVWEPHPSNCLCLGCDPA